MDKGSDFDFRRDKEIFLFSKISGPAIGTRRIIYSIRTEVPAQGVKRTENKSDQSPPSGMAQAQLYLLPQLLKWYLFCKFKLLIKDVGATSGAVSSGVTRRIISSCKGSYTRASRNVCTPVTKMMITLVTVWCFHFLTMFGTRWSYPIAVPCSSRRLKLLEFLEILHREVGNLSALCTEYLYPLLISVTG